MVFTDCAVRQPADLGVAMDSQEPPLELLLLLLLSFLRLSISLRKLEQVNTFFFLYVSGCISFIVHLSELMRNHSFLVTAATAMAVFLNAEVSVESPSHRVMSFHLVSAQVQLIIVVVSCVHQR